MKRYAAKAPRSDRARGLLQSREHARMLFNAIKALPVDSPLHLVSVAGVNFRTDARPRKLAAND